jgi:hypothetical protein
MRNPLTPLPKIKGAVRHGSLVLLFYTLLFLLFFSPVLLSNSLIGTGDTVFYHIPYFYAKKVLWDPLLLSGFPMMADPQVMTWYPPAFIFSLFPGSWNYFVISAYVMAACFAYGYVYTLTASRVAGTLSGIVYGMTGFMVAQLDHAAIIHTAAWLPLIIWSLERLRQKLSAAWFAVGCVAVACINFAGHSQIFVYSMMAAFAYALVLGLIAPVGRVRYYLLCALMFTLGVGLAAVQIVPMMELVRLSLRSKIPFEIFIGFSLPPQQILMLVFPALFGGLSAYGDTPYFGKWNFIEIAGYLGLLSLMLAGLGLAAHRQRVVSMFWVSVGVTALVLAMSGETPVAQLTYQVPVINLFRAQARYYCLLAFAISVLAGLGASAVVAGRVTRRVLLGTLLSSSAVMLICLAGLYFTPVNAYAAKNGFAAVSLLPWRNRAVGVPLLLFLICSTALFYWHARPASRLRIALLVLAALADMCSFGLWYARDYRSPKDGVSAPPATVARYKPELTATNQRIMPVRGAWGTFNELPPNYSRLWGVPSASIYSPLVLTDVQRFLSMHTVGDLDPTWQKGDDQSLNLMAVRYVFTPRLKLTEEAHGATWFAGDSVFSLGSGCNIPNPRTVRIEVPHPSSATKIGVVSLLGCSTDLEDGAEVLRILVTDVDGKTDSLSMRAGVDTSEWAYDCDDVRPQMKHRRAAIFKSFSLERGRAACEGHEYLTRLPLKELGAIKSIVLEWAGASGAIGIKKLTLIDERTGRSVPFGALPDSIYDESRWRRLEDINNEISVYENLRAMPRAWLAREVISLKPDETLAVIKSSRLPDGRVFDPSRTALMEEPLKLDAGGGEDVKGEGGVEVLAASGSHMELRTRSAAPSLLVLSDTYYPGWRATVDGRAAEVYRTDFALRGVQVPSGNHTVRLEFRPKSFYYGLLLSSLSFVVMVIMLFRLARAARRSQYVDNQ